ncbi:MAG: sigma-54-dependent Fis family transcriptional regulator [Candidatus Latescibacterota bacterium]|nr:MAG: sigma-54-dependent Fis family transcriptional regulator [Candidatus Latescibacterota bacterium]
MKNATEKERILIVDDSPETLEMLERNLRSGGYEVFTAPGVAEAIKILDDVIADLVITDYKMPKSSGMDLIRYVRENLKNTEVMMITGYATVEGAVDAIKAGAEEYLTKPFTDEELFSAVRRALDKRRLRIASEDRLPQTIGSRYGILGESEPMRQVFSAIAKAASTPATVLITGQSGTGKELVARAIHYSSKRASAPFVPVNCGGIPEGLLESELFGYVKGAFTGALESRAGFFQTADGGTIFLDEVSETSLAMQVKLLRVLQEKEIFMVGSTQPRKVNVRILAATNKVLLGLVKKGNFREDLYYRLNVIEIAIPPLRDRADDIILLASHFARKYSEEVEKPEPRFSDKALEILRNYAWPGNVRELENVVQSLVVMTDSDVIDVPDLPHLMRYTGVRDKGLHRTLDEVEAAHIRDVLALVGGNKTRAAEILGIDRKTLREKMKRLDPGSA